uniref:Uncharacterized protein n=1 Tax=Arundo donax TaxID=35708 RepID=A0A0A9H9Y3_ARUDO
MIRSGIQHNRHCARVVLDQLLKVAASVQLARMTSFPYSSELKLAQQSTNSPQELLF